MGFEFMHMMNCLKMKVFVTCVFYQVMDLGEGEDIKCICVHGLYKAL